MNFSDAELERYARHIVLKEIGAAGQAALKAARVLVIGAGGIGSPAIQYLAAAGVGTIAIVDDDRVEASNLQRQTIFGEGDLGAAKADAAAARARAINPFAQVDAIAHRIDAGNVDWVRGVDVVIDGTDNFATRLLVADACLRHRVPLVSAAVSQFEGQLGVFRGWEADKPCYRCWAGDDPARDGINCAEEGVLGAMTGVMGSLAALEAIRAITGFGDDPAGKMLIADALAFRFRTIGLPKDPGVLRMRGLTVVLASADPGRFRAGVVMAMATAALGGAARVYAHEEAVRLLGEALIGEALDAGVGVIACQTGLAAAGIDLSALDTRIEAGGMVSLLAGLGDDRLVVA